MTSRRPFRGSLASFQIGLALLGLLALSFLPAARGPMALIALDGRDAATLAAPAIARGATLLGRGPGANILIVEGRRDRILWPMLGRGALVVAAPASWCGAQGRRV
jgi:hypothetical protein